MAGSGWWGKEGMENTIEWEKERSLIALWACGVPYIFSPSSSLFQVWKTGTKLLVVVVDVDVFCVGGEGRHEQDGKKERWRGEMYSLNSPCGTLKLGVLSIYYFAAKTYIHLYLM